MEKRKYKEPLTNKQRNLFEFIKQFMNEHGHSPTRGEIARKFDVRINNVSRYIDILCKKGWLIKDSSKRPPVIKIL